MDQQDSENNYLCAYWNYCGFGCLYSFACKHRVLHLFIILICLQAFRDIRYDMDTTYFLMNGAPIHKCTISTPSVHAMLCIIIDSDLENDVLYGFLKEKPSTFTYLFFNFSYTNPYMT